VSLQVAWKGAALYVHQNRAMAPCTPPQDPITLDSLKAVLKLPGVGKGTVDKVNGTRVRGVLAHGAWGSW
jgi:hypothetical protein